MHIVVGLGNPGRKYEGTRHNVGFDVLRQLSRRLGGDRPKVRFEAELGEVSVGGNRVLLVAPQTYMNLSGRSVRQVVDFYRVAVPDVLVVCDDINLPAGKLRIRSGGSAGGQKGLDDVIRHLGTKDVPRLRIGVGSPPPPMDAADYVLGKIGSADEGPIAEGVSKACDAACVWVERGLTAAMNEFNAGGGIQERGLGTSG